MRLDPQAIIWLSVVHCPMAHCATPVDPLSIPRTADAQLTHGWVYHQRWGKYDLKKMSEVMETQHLATIDNQ